MRSFIVLTCGPGGSKTSLTNALPEVHFAAGRTSALVEIQAVQCLLARDTAALEQFTR